MLSGCLVSAGFIEIATVKAYSCMGLTSVKYNIGKLSRVGYSPYPAEHFTFWGKCNLNVRGNAGLNSVTQ